MRCIRAIFVLFLLASHFVFAGSDIQIKPDRESGIYEPGQPVAWSIEIQTADKKPASGKIAYKVKIGGLDELSAGYAELSEGKAIVTATRPDAGSLLLEVKYKGDGDEKELQRHGGAVFAPEKIKPSAEPPEDFDTFWAGKIAQLNAIPMNVQITPVETKVPDVEYFKITMDNINGTKVYGQLAKPKGKNENLPAMLQVQYAGVYKLEPNWVTDQARNGWLSFNIIAHDLPIDQPDEFYKEKSQNELKDYTGIGNDDRDKTYFLRMFLSCYRAVDYLTQRPEWNKKTVLVHGGSQGGYQAYITAGLHPKVTHFCASVPAGCDHTGRQARRAPGWPNWGKKNWQNKDEAKKIETARYFDAMNFAGRIKCEALVGIGLIDVVCPAEGAIATFNKLQGPKKLVIMPRTGHGGEGLGQELYYKEFGPFLNAAKAK
ncbi:MAG TPA: acetylxylan esterase [Planctomycetota bacterium]|nr:acetylxylan esterase [Planctomycetota bacterium]